MNCQTFCLKNKLKSHERECENKGFCNNIMLSEDTKMLDFGQHQKSDKAPFIIYGDLKDSWTQK